jgi:hypothetical protein
LHDRQDIQQELAEIGDDFLHLRAQFPAQVDGIIPPWMAVLFAAPSGRPEGYNAKR